MSPNPLRLATRTSPLALWQAHHVRDLLQAVGHGAELVMVTTRGDRVIDRPLHELGGDGLFTREVQEVVLAGEADVAIHSLKDLPTAAVPGLTLAGIPARGPQGDAWVSRIYPHLADVPLGSRVATGSMRRRAQLLNRRPDLQVEDLRGNIGTRLSRLADEGLSGIILAEAGLRRLGLDAEIREILDPTWMLPAVGQGALGLECRTDDQNTQDLLKLLTEPTAWATSLAERAMLRALGGGCLVPVGVFSTTEGTTGRLVAVVLDETGARRLEVTHEGPLADPQELGESVARALIDAGADSILSTVEKRYLGQPTNRPRGA
jgi:hydroxymethylbilane synthase